MLWEASFVPCCKLLTIKHLRGPPRKLLIIKGLPAPCVFAEVEVREVALLDVFPAALLAAAVVVAALNRRATVLLVRRFIGPLDFRAALFALGVFHSGSSVASCPKKAREKSAFAKLFFLDT